MKNLGYSLVVCLVLVNSAFAKTVPEGLASRLAMLGEMVERHSCGIGQVGTFEKDLMEAEGIFSDAVDAMIAARNAKAEYDEIRARISALRKNGLPYDLANHTGAAVSNAAYKAANMVALDDSVNPGGATFQKGVIALDDKTSAQSALFAAAAISDGIIAMDNSVSEEDFESACCDLDNALSQGEAADAFFAVSAAAYWDAATSDYAEGGLLETDYAFAVSNVLSSLESTLLANGWSTPE